MTGTERQRGLLAEQIPDAAPPLLGSLRLRLARLRRLDDPRTSALALQCEELLQVIDKELDDLAAKRRRR